MLAQQKQINLFYLSLPLCQFLFCVSPQLCRLHLCAAVSRPPPFRFLPSCLFFSRSHLLVFLAQIAVSLSFSISHFTFFSGLYFSKMYCVFFTFCTLYLLKSGKSTALIEGSACQIPVLLLNPSNVAVQSSVMLNLY